MLDGRFGRTVAHCNTYSDEIGAGLKSAPAAAPLGVGLQRALPSNGPSLPPQRRRPRRCARPAGAGRSAACKPDRDRRTARAAAAAGRLSGVVRHHLRATALDRKRGRHLGTARGRIRSVRPRCGPASPCSQARAHRTVAAEDQGHEGDRQCDSPRYDRSRCAFWNGSRCGACSADRTVRGGAVDRRHLSLFCLGHADVWPAGDLALQEAVRLAFALKQRPASKEMVRLAEPWRPWRSVAAHVLWKYYRTIKGRDATPLPAKSNGAANAR